MNRNGSVLTRATAQRLFRLLLRLYPPGYRSRYGQEMTAFFHRERAASGGGPRFWARLALDHLEAAWSVRTRRRGEGTMGMLKDDLRGALRSLARAPGFTLFAVGTLALGVGATAGVYTVLDRVVLRPLPYAGAERMVLVGPTNRFRPGRPGNLSPALMAALERSPGPAETVVGVGPERLVLTGAGDPVRLEGRRVTRDFFRLFQGHAVAGRLFTHGDHSPDAPPVAVLAHALWLERFGGDPGVVGRTLRLGGESVTVVGVAAPDFRPPERVRGPGDVWLPFRFGADEPAGTFFITSVARLRPGSSPAVMDAHLSDLVDRVYPPDDGPRFLQGAASEELRQAVVGPRLGPAIQRTLGAVALLLLIACVNAASLLLTRGAQRRHEMAVRAALGAGRGRLIQQLLLESTFLAVGAAALGTGLALGGLALFRRYAPGGLPRLAEVGVDGPILLVTVALALATVLLFGLVPALRATRSPGRGAGAGGGRSTGSRRDGRVRATLVAVETALAVVLVVGSGLLAHDLARVSTEDPGFRSEGLVALRLDRRQSFADTMDPDEVRTFWSIVLERTRALPGVESATLTSALPYTSDGIVSTYMPEGWRGQDPEEGALIPTLVVAADFLETTGVSLVEGRSFSEEEERGSRQVALVNEALVREYWPEGGGVGRTVKSGGPGVDDEGSFEVVGVVGDVSTRHGVPASPTLLLPAGWQPWQAMDLVVRTEQSTAELVQELRAVIHQVDPGLPVDRVTTVESLASGALARPRFYTGLFGGFAVLALLLAVVGVYGTTAFAARSRTREIGIRLALGADGGRVVRGIVRRTGLTLFAGVGAGLTAAAALAPLLSANLLRVDPRNVPTYAVVAVAVLAAGLLAAWVPARRAGAVDPAVTLREE